MYILEYIEYLTYQGDLEWDFNLFSTETWERLSEACLSEKMPGGWQWYLYR